ncbi:MAG: hypothetical protein ACI9OF_001130, partial [Saprospiraceae bacterium]
MDNQKFGFEVVLSLKHSVIRAGLGSIVCAVALASCGGGAEPPTVSLTPPAQQQAASSLNGSDNGTVVITGGATKGPIRGANVTFYALDEFGFADGPALATAITDATGNFTASISGTTSLVLVETRGGSFIDESDQEPDLALKRQLSLSSTQGFVSILPPGATTVAITPFSQALVEKVRLESQTGGFDTR